MIKMPDKDSSVINLLSRLSEQYYNKFTTMTIKCCQWRQMEFFKVQTVQKIYARLPYGLILLLSFQILFFFTIGLNNQQVRQAAVDYYFDSGLYRIEFPFYVSFLQKYIGNDEYYQRLETINSGNVTNIEMYWMQIMDPFFQNEIDRELSNLSSSENRPQYQHWKEKRGKYLQFFEKDLFISSSFRSASPRPIDFVVSIFSTGNFQQFFVCLLFLIIMGLLLEGKIGSLLLTEAYFLGGTLMISFYCLLAPYSLMPIYGGNGGVSCLLGILSALYGMQKEKINYYNGKGFSSVYVACFVFMPFWITVEYALYYLGYIDLVNIICQIPAILGGMIIGLYLRQQASEVVLVDDIIPGTNDLHERFELASKELTHGNKNEAKKMYYALLKEYPNNKEIYIALIDLLKVDPASNEYHDMVKQVLSLSDPTNDLTAMIHSVFQDYVTRAQPKINIDYDVFFKTIQRFSRSGYFDDAIQLIKILSKNDNDVEHHKALSKELFTIAMRQFEKFNDEDGRQMLSVLIEYFPNTDEAMQARMMLEKK